METENYWNRTAARGTRRRFLAGGGAAAVGLAGWAVAGCGDDDDAAAPTPARAAGGTTAPAPSASAAGGTSAAGSTSAAASPTSSVKKGGSVAVNGVGNLDAPHQDVHQTGTQLLSSYGMGMAYSRLVRFKVPPETKSPWNGEYVPDLAASVEQPDSTTVVFKLRPNAKFHNVAPVNGRAATAQDVLYSFQRQKDLKVNATLLPPWDAIEAPDAATVRFKLKQPDAEFVPTIAVYQNKVIAKEAVDVHGDLKTGPTIGTGPWILQEWKSGESATLKKNPDYFLSGFPYLDEFIWRRIGDVSTALAAMKSGQIMVMGTGVNPDMVESVKGDKNLTADGYQQYGDQYINFKMDVEPFKDARVREAVFRALNYDQLIQVTFQGAGYTTGGISVPAPDWETPQSALKNYYKQDLAAVKSLLSAAGQSNLNLQIGFLQLAPANKLIEQMQPQLKAAGIDSTLVPLDNVGYIANSLSPGGKYVMIVGSQSPSPLATADIRPRYYSGGSRNASGLADKDFDAMIDKQAQTLDPAARKTLLLELQKYFHDRYYHWSIGQVRQKLRNTSFKGVESMVFSEYDCWTRAWLDKA